MRVTLFWRYFEGKILYTVRIQSISSKIGFLTSQHSKIISRTQSSAVDVYSQIPFLLRNSVRRPKGLYWRTEVKNSSGICPILRRGVHRVNNQWIFMVADLVAKVATCESFVKPAIYHTKCKAYFGGEIIRCRQARSRHRRLAALPGPARATTIVSRWRCAYIVPCIHHSLLENAVNYIVWNVWQGRFNFSRGTFCTVLQTLVTSDFVMSGCLLTSMYRGLAVLVDFCPDPAVL